MSEDTGIVARATTRQETGASSTCLCVLVAILGLAGVIGCEGAVSERRPSVRVDEEPPGTRCAGGGIVVHSGVDANASGALEDREIQQSYVLCDGRDGESGEPWLVDTEELPPGETCALGGVRVRTGVDEDRDGVLGEDETAESVDVCAALIEEAGSGSDRPVCALAPRAECDGVDLQGANLSGLDLRGISLRRAALNEADLSETRLDDAELTASNLFRAEMAGAEASRAILDDVNANLASARGARFVDASFVDASLISADLRDADLSGADLTDASLENAMVSGATFTGAMFSGTTCPDGTASDEPEGDGRCGLGD